jgi:S1-C subfamily serine protease
MRSNVLVGIVLLASAAMVRAADAPNPDAATSQQKLQAAHERLEQAAREVAELSSTMAGEHMPDRLLFLGRNPNRAMLGIGIGGAHERETDNGVAVLSVSPDGPAAKAGIKAGDIVVELNGKSLQRDKETAPREKLLNEMSKLSPGDDVTVRYTRDGKAATVKLKAEHLPSELATREFHLRVPPLGAFEFNDRDFPHRFGFSGAPLPELELAPLSAKLGQYFGTDKGLLVVHAPERSDFKLEDGDVLIDIDGRVPRDPGHAFRILDSYQPGEKFTLNVLRQHKKTALAVTLSERDERHPRPRPARGQDGPRDFMRIPLPPPSSAT